MDRRRRPEGVLNCRPVLSCVFANLFISAVMIYGACGCSVVMEAARPTPADLHRFSVGESRADVHQELGDPSIDTAQGDGEDCEVYQLYTTGYGAGGKAGIAAAEGTADILTMGLAEIAMTPAEALTRNKKRPVTFCYASDKLARVELGAVTALNSAPPHTVADSSPRVRSARHHRRTPQVFARSGHIWQTPDSQPKPLIDSPFPPTYVLQQGWPSAGLPLTYVVPTSGTN